MELKNKKLNKFLNYAGKVVALVTLVIVVFSPFSQIFNIPIVQAALLANQPFSMQDCLAQNPGNTVGCQQTQLQNATASQTQLNPVAANGNNDFGCSFSNATGLNGGQAFASCIAAIVYYIGPGLASNIAYVGAYFFSYTISLSLNSVAYALDFLATGWSTVRDLANMAFILILVYIACMIMFQAETTGTIKTLAWVIFIALIINFSFFLTRVVIDTGNVLSVQFYNAIPQTATIGGTDTGGGVVGGSLAGATTGTLGGGTGATSAFSATGVKDLSASVMQAVGLQSLFSNSSFQAAINAAGGSVTGGLITISLVYLALAVMFWILFFVFLQVGIKFLMRIVVLWFLIIAAPLALVSKAIPRPAVQKYYDMWQRYLINFSFYPAIFLFIYLILIKFIQQMLLGQSGNLISNIFAANNTSTVSAAAQANLGVAGAIANVSIRMGFIVAMFYIALKASDWIVTEGSAMASNLSGRLTGAAIGTAAFAGRVGVGGVIGGTIARQDKLANGGLLARGLWNTGRFLNKRTYDTRNLPGARTALGALGGDLIKGRKLDTGQGHTQTARSMEKKIEAFGEWLTEGPSEAALKEKKELNDRVAQIKAKRDTQRMGVLNAYNIPKIEGDYEKTEKDIKRRDALEATNAYTRPLTAAESVEYGKLLRANLEDKKRALEDQRKAVEKEDQGIIGKKKSGKDKSKNKSWDELKTEQAVLSKRMEGLTASQITSLKASDIEGVIKQISDSHLKAIRESGKYTADAVKEIGKKWNEDNKKAPLSESKKQLEELGKIRDLLKEKGMSNVDAKLPTVHNSTRSDNEVAIDLKTAETMKKEVTALKDEQEDIRRNGLTAADKTAAGQRERELKKAETNLDKLIEKVKEIPEDVGGEKAPMAFKHQASAV